MCNFLHEPVTPIPEEGVAYKLFVKRDGYYFPLTMFGYCNEYDTNPTKGVTWDEGLEGDGFCMIMTKRSARMALAEWGFTANIVLRKITYKKGLGKFKENDFCSRVNTIALCKWFKIIEEV